MITDTIEDYLQTGSGRLLNTIISGHLTSHLTIAPHSGANFIPTISLDEAKFSFNVLSGGTLIAQIDNDHPIDISGSQFRGLHEHEFISGSTINRIPIGQINSVAEAGSYAHNLWRKFF